MKKILLIGVGLVSKPLIKYLLNSPNIFLTAIDKNISNAEKLFQNHSNGKLSKLDLASQKDEFENLIEENDLAVSLLPAPFHPKVAELCLKHKKHLVTCSYVSDEMRTFSEVAEKLGLLFLNEVGLDPGIDHMSAMKIIQKVQDKGGKIIDFYSFCGGIPAPEASMNLFRYKFSWSPRGVVTAAMNDGIYLLEGEKRVVPNKNLFVKTRLIEVPHFGFLESYVNRDCFPYIEKYNIQGVRNLYRGTLRYLGWCATWNAFRILDLVEHSEEIDCTNLTKIDYLSQVTGIRKDKLEDYLPKIIGLADASDVMKRLEWLGFLSEEEIGIDKGDKVGILTSILESKLIYQEGERDMTILYHKFLVEYESHREEITSTLLDYGNPNDSKSMAKLVGLPAAVAARYIVEGKIKVKGVKIPVTPEIYNPILEELANRNVRFIEECRSLI